MTRALSLALLLVAWAIVSALFDLRAALLPDFFSVLLSLWMLMRDGDVFYHLGVTVSRVFAAVSVSLLVAVPAGLSLVDRPSLGTFFMTILDLLRGIPVAMLFPVFIILFGIGEVSRMAIALYLSMPIVLLAAYYGGRENRDNAGRRIYLRIHEARLPRYIRVLNIAFDALPSLMAGIRTAISFSLVVVVVTEMFFISSSGIGWAAYHDRLAQTG